MTNVYTCTMNLAIDLFIETESMYPSIVNRTIDGDIQANGKGVNVSLVLKMLGIENTALGFKAGFTGQYIEDFLKEESIQTDFIDVPGLTRINVFTKVVDEGKEFKLVNSGPEIPKERVNMLLQRIKLLKMGDYLCISGSLPKGVEPSILVEISEICQEIGIKLILDSSAETVIQCLKYQPFLIKPNEEELESWFKVTLKTREDYLEYGKKLIEKGAQNVLISLGEVGAIFLNKETVLFGNAPIGEVVNSACAGDTLLSTFLSGVIKNDNINKMLKKSIAAGSSTAFRKGLTDLSDIDFLEKQVNIIELN